MALTARDIMQSQVITVSPLDPVHVVQRLFFEEEIHGAPVVDDEGHVQGVVTSMDLLRGAAEENEGGGGSFSDSRDASIGDWEDASDDFKNRLGEITVAEVMTENVVSVEPNAPVAVVAKLMRENRIHRVLVVRNRTLLGIISSFDLIRLIEREAEPDRTKSL